MACAEELAPLEHSAPEATEGVDAEVLESARAAIEALACPAFSPHTHSSGAPNKLKVLLCSHAANLPCW